MQRGASHMLVHAPIGAYLMQLNDTVLSACTFIGMHQQSIKYEHQIARHICVQRWGVETNA